VYNVCINYNPLATSRLVAIVDETSVDAMMMLMIHGSQTCTDACTIYLIIQAVVPDMNCRLNTPVTLVATSLNSSSQDVSHSYCEEYGTTYEAVDIYYNKHGAESLEINSKEFVLLTTPQVASVNLDDTMRAAGKFISRSIRVVMLHNYSGIIRDNLSENLIYYSF